MLWAICLQKFFSKVVKFLLKKTVLKFRWSFLPNHSRNNSIIMKRLSRVRDYTLVKQPLAFHSNYDFVLQPASYKTKRIETRRGKDITRSQEKTIKGKRKTMQLLSAQSVRELANCIKQVAKSILELYVCHGQFLNLSCHKFVSPLEATIKTQVASQLYSLLLINSQLQGLSYRYSHPYLQLGMKIHKIFVFLSPAGVGWQQPRYPIIP